MPGNKLNVIIVGHILENHWYKGKFDPKKANSPSCFAFATDLKDLAPRAAPSETPKSRASRADAPAATPPPPADGPTG